MPDIARNVIVIMTDQQRADSLGCLGNPVALTPNLDALAKRSAVMRSHFTPHQICSPSRATLFTGLFSRHHGLTRNGIALAETMPTLSSQLQAAGLRTHGVGKFHFQPILADASHKMPDSNAFWKLPESVGWNGPFYGFDTVDILIGESVACTEGGHYARWLSKRAPGAGELYKPEHALFGPLDDMEEVWKSAIPDELHYNSWITDRACDFLATASAEDAFFLFVSYPDPHHPFSPPAPWCDLYDPDKMPLPSVLEGELDAMPRYVRDAAPRIDKSYVDFLRDPGPPQEQGFMMRTQSISPSSMALAIAHTYGMISMIDAGVGRILDAASHRGLLADTLVIFTSDHGELLGDHGLLRKGPSPYRQLLNIPFLVAGPGVEPGDRRQMTSHVDVKATILDMLGLPEDAGDGHSFANILREPGTQGPGHLFAEYHHRVDPDTYNTTILTEDWRLTVYPKRSDWGELFDRRADFDDHINLYGLPAYAKVQSDLAERLRENFPPAPLAGGQPLAVY